MLIAICTLCECPIDVIANNSNITIGADQQLTAECFSKQTLYNVSLIATNRTTPLFSELDDDYIFVNSSIQIKASEEAENAPTLFTDKVNSLQFVNSVLDFAGGNIVGEATSVEMDQSILTMENAPEYMYGKTKNLRISRT